VLAGAGGWLPGPHAIWPDIFRLYLCIVGIVAGLVIPRRWWVCPPGVLLGIAAAGWCVVGNGEEQWFYLPIAYLVVVIGFPMTGFNFGGAAAGAFLRFALRQIMLRRRLGPRRPIRWDETA
jgi:hypothetical protein